MNLIEQAEFALALLKECQKALPEDQKDLKSRVHTFLMDQIPETAPTVRAYNLPKR